MTEQTTETRDEAIRAAAKAVDALWGGRYAPHEVDELGDEMCAALAAAVPLVLDEVARRIEADGREVVQFLAGDETKEGRFRLVGAEDAYKDALAVVEKYRNEWSTE